MSNKQKKPGFVPADDATGPVHDERADAPPVMKEQGPNIPVDDALAALLKQLGSYGVVVNVGHLDMNNLGARIMSAATIRLLINKGIVTEAEAGAQAQETLRELMQMLCDQLDAAAKQARSQLLVAAKDVDVAAIMRDKRGLHIQD